MSKPATARVIRLPSGGCRPQIDLADGRWQISTNGVCWTADDAKRHAERLAEELGLTLNWEDDDG